MLPLNVLKRSSGGLIIISPLQTLIIPPPRVNHLDVVGRLTPSMKWKPRIHSAPLTREPGRAVTGARADVT
jgi:hypothetical protein